MCMPPALKSDPAGLTRMAGSPEAASNGGDHAPVANARSWAIRCSCHSRRTQCPPPRRSGVRTPHTEQTCEANIQTALGSTAAHHGSTAQRRPEV